MIIQAELIYTKKRMYDERVRKVHERGTFSLIFSSAAWWDPMDPITILLFISVLPPLSSRTGVIHTIRLYFGSDASYVSH